jgi:hypothetical protein
MSTPSDETKPLYVKDPESWIHSVADNENDFVCVVIFRGSWCSFDKLYLQKLGQYKVDTMKKDFGVKLIAWTSEGAEGASKADEAWQLTSQYGYDQVIGDESNALANYLIDEVILPDLVVSTPQDIKVDHLITPGTYPNGIVQPGMVWYAHLGTLVLQWQAKVEEPYFGGPFRPDPAELWRQLEKRKHALDIGSTIMPMHDFKHTHMCATPEDI